MPPLTYNRGSVGKDFGYLVKSGGDGGIRYLGGHGIQKEEKNG